MIYDDIARVLPQIPNGWCELDKAIALASIVTAIRPNVVVEVGVFGGRSFIPMAMACRANGKGKAIGIDPWSKADGVAGYTGDNAAWWGSLDYETIYSEFIKDVHELELHRYVDIHRKKSDDVTPPEVIDIFHCDGQHTDQAIRDVERFASKVRRGGFCVTDDDSWDGGGPQEAIRRLMKMNFVPLYQLGTGTVFQRS